MGRGDILLVAGSTILTLAAVEYALRIAGIEYPDFYQPDAVRGGALRPGASGWYRQEGGAYVQINSDGLRDVEHAVGKPAGVFRIAVLGDSYAEALQVPLERTFWHVLGQRLRAGCRRRVEVMNFGVGGYGTGQEWLTLTGAVWKYRPDLVMLAFLTGNDVRDNLRELNPVGMRPYFDMRNGRLVTDRSFRSLVARRDSLVWRFYHAVRARSRLVQLAARAKDGAGPPPRAGEEPGLDSRVYLDPRAGGPEALVWGRAWEVTEAILDRMAAEVARRGARFVVVTLTNAIQVDPDPARRRQFAGRIGAADLFYPDERIALWGRGREVPVITLAPEMAALAEQRRVYFHGFANTRPGSGHWNEEGHRVAGELIAARLCVVRWFQHVAPSRDRKGAVEDLRKQALEHDFQGELDAPRVGGGVEAERGSAGEAVHAAQVVRAVEVSRIEADDVVD